MTWVAVGVAGVGAVKGTMDANSAKEKQKQHDKYRKTAMIYSPWTGMEDIGAGNFGNTDGVSGALGGGLQGFAMGSQINGMAGAGAGAEAGAAAQVPEGTQMSALNYQPKTPQAFGPKSPWAGMQQPGAQAQTPYMMMS